MITETILSKSFDFLKILLPALTKLPKNYKFNLGDRTQTTATELMEILVEAYYTRPERKQELLNRANIKIEMLRRFLRLIFELGLYSSSTYGRLSEQLDEIGRMNGGWLKSLK